MLFDPRVGTGAFMQAALLAEMCFNTADKAAESNDHALSDSFWLLGALIAH